MTQPKKIKSFEQLKTWNKKWSFHLGQPLKQQIPNVSEWAYSWFFSVAVYDFSIARELFFELALFYRISSNVSVEEGYAIVMVNLDYWFFKGGHKKVESEYKHFKANLFLADPMTLV